MDELKPCPFCGGEATRFPAVVECKDCGVQGPLGYDGKDSVTAWNTRVPVTDEMVERAAKGIAEHTFAVCDPGDASDCREWEDMPEHVRRVYIMAARAALTAALGGSHG